MRYTRWTGQQRAQFRTLERMAQEGIPQKQLQAEAKRIAAGESGLEPSLLLSKHVTITGNGLSRRVRTHLKRHGSKTYRELVQALDADPRRLTNCLQLLKRRGWVASTGRGNRRTYFAPPQDNRKDAA